LGCVTTDCGPVFLGERLLKLKPNLVVSVIALIMLDACGGGSSGGGGGNPVAPSITVQPVNRTVPEGGTATFSVTANGTAPLSYQWQNAATAANIAGATSSSYSIANVTTGDSGMTFLVIVSNTAGSQTSNTVTLTVNPVPPPSNVSVLTYHNDIARTGQNLNETILTTANVASANFGMLGSITVDGAVDAEPLYVGGVSINGTVHNVLLVVTENDSVYAFDADTFAQLWHVSALPAGETVPTASGDFPDCTQVAPQLGITSTPVIDRTSVPNGAIFVVAMSVATSTFHHRLHALDLTTGADLMAATDIQATSGALAFVPKQYEERSGLLLLNNVIYLTWTSHCDVSPYNGWVMGYRESSLQQASVINVTPGGGGGIWMSGDGLAADSSGNIYFLDGNGSFDSTPNAPQANGNYGNAFIKLSTANNTLAVADYFAMFDTVSESGNDRDLGSGGLVVLPDMTDANNVTRHLAVGAGKSETSRNGDPVPIYVVDRDNMGKFSPNNDNAIYQEISGALLGGSGGNGVWAAPAYFNNTIYYGAVSDALKAIPITQAKLAASASSHTSTTFGYPGATPSISANGSVNPPTNGIVWAIANGSGANTLFAFDATNLANQLFSGAFTGDANTKFVTPMIANGKVYVGAGSPNIKTPGVVYVFGLTNQGAQLVKRPDAKRDRRGGLQEPKPPHPDSSTPGN
jgi:hypothetical protein